MVVLKLAWTIKMYLALMWINRDLSKSTINQNNLHEANRQIVI